MEKVLHTKPKELKIRLSSRVIYEVSLQYVGSLTTLRHREPAVIFFSNLRKAVDAITSELAMNNWPAKINYTAVYRGIKQRGFFGCEFDVAGTRVFRIKVVPKILNPVLPRLGVDENPEK